jgi:hypothetical protein
MARQNSINNKSSPITLDPGSASDTYTQYSINGTAEFRTGVKDSDGSYRISQGSAFGTNDTMIVESTGIINYPLQAAFLWVNNADQTDVTGGGTDYTVTFENEVFDTQGSFDGTSTFTAPVTGKYFLTYSLFLDGITTGMTNSLCFIVTTAATYRHFQVDFAPGQSAGGNYVFSGSALCNMTAADTAVVHVRLLNGSNVVTIVGVTNAGFRAPYFGGYLVA